MMFSICLMISLVSWVATVANTASDRPSFILMFADDFGWGDLGANFAETKETPNLDRLASNGVRFTDFHAGASVCTPSRAALLTGRLGKRTGVTHNFSPTSVAGLPLNETTVAEMLKASGYSTGMIGKWHLGVNGPFHPSHRGFDFYFGLPYSNDMGCVDDPGYNLPEQKACPKDNSSVTPTVDEFHHANLESDVSDSVPLYLNTKIIEQPVNLDNLSDRYALMASDFIHNQTEDNPFFLYVAFTHMHVPQNHDPKYTNASMRKTVFADTLLEMDATVGAILRALEKHGLTENTLLWFTADNGPWETKCQYTGLKGPYQGSWQKQMTGSSTGKFTTWEGGHREPGIVYWKGKIKPRISDALVSALDVLPTIAALSRSPLPSYRRFDGIDISHVLLNGSDEGHEHLFHPNSGVGPSGELNTVRYKEYKAMYLSGGSGSCKHAGSQVTKHDPPLIFNVKEDPAESTPLNLTMSKNNIIAEVEKLLVQIHNDIHTDNTTVTDYKSSKSAMPCCNPHHVVCRCTD